MQKRRIWAILFFMFPKKTSLKKFVDSECCKLIQVQGRLLSLQSTNIISVYLV